MRRLNIKLLVGLAGLGVLLSGGAILAHRFQVRRTARALFREAVSEQRRDRLDLAEKALGRYLGLKPRDTDALAWHATLLDKLATTPKARLAAYMAYEEVLRREPSRREHRLRIVRLARELWRFPDARKHLEILLESRPNDAEIETLLGECFEASGDAERAASWYEKARAHDPHRLRAFERLAVLLRTRLDASRRADRVMDKMVEANPRSSRAHLDRALYRQRFQIAGAEQDIKKARDLGPEVPDVLLEVASVATRNSKFDEARGVLASGVEGHPDDPRMYQALADVELRDGRADAADAWLRKGIGRVPGDLSLRWTLADLLARRGATTELAEQSARLRKDGYPAGPLAFLDACLHFNRGEWAVARRGFESALSKLADRPDLKARAYDLLARCFGRLGDTDQQVAAFRRAVTLDPLWAAPRLGLASTLASAGKVDEADRVLQKLPDSSLAAADLFQLASGIAIQASDPDRALDLARRATALHPDGYNEQLWLGQVLWAADRRTEAEAALRRATDLAGDVPEPWVALVQFLAGTGSPERAEAAILRAESVLPKGQGTLALARCFEAIGRDDRAGELYRQAEASHPADPAVLRPVALFFLRTGRIAEAEERLRAILDKVGGFTDSAWARRSLALSLIADGNYPRAREALEVLAPGDDLDDRRVLARVLVAQKTRRQAQEAARELEHLDTRESLTDDDRFLLARLDEANDDWPKACEQWKALLASQPDNPLFLAQFAAGLRRHGRTDEARTLVERLEWHEPGSFRTVELKARILHDLGRDDEAAAELKTAALKGEGSRIEATAALLEELGRWDDAEAVLRAGAARPGHSEAVLDLAGFLGRRGRIDEALDLCERAWKDCPPERVAAASVAALAASKADAPSIDRVARRLDEAIVKTPDVAPILVSMGTVRELQGRYRDAEDLYRRAIERDGRDGVPLNNLAWLTALEVGDPAKALEMINRAIDLDGPEPELLDTRGVIYLALGRRNQALENLNEAVADTPSASRFFHLAQVYLKADDRKAATEAMGHAKALGLEAGRLHPLELPAYDRMVVELAAR